MAKFPYNVCGYRFQDGVNTLRLSFQFAINALSADLARAITESSAYEDGIAQGGAEIGEWDDDGNKLSIQTNVLEMQVESVEEAAMALRKAFVIALYHHWERSVRLWTASANGKHDALTSAALAKG
jgi:hypothetical protein